MINVWKPLLALGFLWINIHICHARPSDVSGKDVPSKLDVRAGLPSNNLQGDYSFFSFQPTSRADLLTAASKINPENLALFFSPGFTELDYAINSSSVEELGTILNNLFANNLTRAPLSSGQNGTRGELGDPTDPDWIYERKWRVKVFDYELDGARISASKGQQMVSTMLAEVTGKMRAAHTTTKSLYPNEGYDYEEVMPDHLVSWSFREYQPALYEDLINAIRLFGFWAVQWGPSSRQALPSCSMLLGKRSSWGSAFRDIAVGGLYLSQSPLPSRVPGQTY